MKQLTVKEKFNKWAREYVHKSPNITKREYGKDAYTGGRKDTLEEMRESYPYMTRKEIKEDLDTELKKIKQ